MVSSHVFLHKKTRILIPGHTYTLYSLYFQYVLIDITTFLTAHNNGFGVTLRSHFGSQFAQIPSCISRTALFKIIEFEQNLTPSSHGDRQNKARYNIY